MKERIFDDDEWIKKILNRTSRTKFICIFVFIVWVPLLVFTWGQSPILDVATHVRFLVSLPLLLISPVYVKNKLTWIITIFLETNIVRGKVEEEFIKIVDSIEDVAESVIAKSIIILVIYAVTFYDYSFSYSSHYITWHADGPAGWWYHFISRPVYWFVLLRFLFHVLLLWPMFYKISRLKLSLRATDPDGAGGIGFLSKILSSLVIPSFALSTAAAAGAANLILYENLSLFGLKMILVAFIGIFLLLFIGPLLIFFPVLARCRIEAISKYGMLSAKQLEEFDEKWISAASSRESYLTVGDFSSLADLDSVMTRIHEMRLVPLKVFDVVGILISVGVPFLPVFSLELPWTVILSNIFSILR